MVVNNQRAHPSSVSPTNTLADEDLSSAFISSPLRDHRADQAYAGSSRSLFHAPKCVDVAAINLQQEVCARPPHSRRHRGSLPRPLYLSAACSSVMCGLLALQPCTRNRKKITYCQRQCAFRSCRRTDERALLFSYTMVLRYSLSGN